ncbi:TPA: LPXTG cell wall anchor domain-containing protein, partial [Streptococcus suis]|nr:LPXTG cell wall anchor domain-containing protein [Streptococcus suis]
NPSLPAGTKVEVGNDGAVTVTYPDGSTDTIPATDTVVTTTPTPQTDAEKNDVTNPTKTPVADTNNLTADEKATVKEEVEKANPNLPEGTKVEVGNNGAVTVTYPDGSVDTISSSDAVTTETSEEPTSQTDADKNGVTNPTKTPVADTNNLTADEKAKVKEEVEKSNPSLPVGTKVEVGNDGTVTVTYPDGSTDTIPATDTVVTTTPTPQTDAEKNDVTNPTKTPVADTNNLTADEKATVKEEVEKANPNLPEGTKIEVGNDGTVTITYPDGSVDTISGADTVVSTTPTPQTDAEKDGIANPSKTLVSDSTKLTDSEKAKVKEEVEKSNPDLPTDAKIEVGNDGTVTITYPDGSVHMIPGVDTVVSTTPTSQTVADKHGIINPTKTSVADTTNLTDDEKAKVKEEVEKSNPSLPTGTKVEVSQDGRVTITYPDGSVDTIPGVATVISTNPTPQTDAEKNGITTPTKTPVADTNNLTEDEKAKVKEEVEKSNPSLPDGTKIEVGNDGTVTITYPDGSVDTISGADTVVSTTPTPQTDADKHGITNPSATPVKVPTNLTDVEKAKVKAEVEKSNLDLPTDAKIEVGNDGTVTITYPDGSVDTISGGVTVFVSKHGDGASQLLPGYDFNADDDKDGFTNGEELKKGSNPNDPNSIPSVSTDTTAPETPIVNASKEGDRIVTGSAEPGSTVTVTFPDGSKVTTVADENGNFAVTVPTGLSLKAGDKVTASATDKAGNVSASSEVTVVVGFAPNANDDSNNVVNNGNTAGVTNETSMNNKQAVLPKTGEESGMMSLMGLVGLAALGLLGFKPSRKEEE